MKHRAWKYALVFLAAIVATAIFWGLNRHASAVAIARVMSQRLEARHACEITVRGKLNLKPADYDAALNRISLDGCPKDFCHAWQAYVHAWDLNAQGRAGAPVYSAEFAGATYAKSATVQADAIRRINETDSSDAFYRCQQIALSYGVQSASN
jgi:hypothetical protein